MVYKYAVLGAGRIGAVHAAAIQANSHSLVNWVIDPNLQSAHSLAEQYGARAGRTAVEALSDPQVDAVIVASPTTFHIEHALEAVAAGKHVLIEKPLGSSIAEIEDSLTELEASPGVVMVGFNRRFDPSIAELRRRVQGGDIGTLLQLTITSRDPHPPSDEYLRSSGGIFNDMTIHDFDLARDFLGNIQSVSAFGNMDGTPYDSLGDFGSAVTTLVSESGAIATILNSRVCVSGYDQRLEIFGSRGQLNMGNLRATTVSYSGADSTSARDRYMDFFLDRYRLAYAQEISAFNSAIAGSPVQLPTVRDGLEALRLAEAATRSAHEGITIMLDDKK